MRELCRAIPEGIKYETRNSCCHFSGGGESSKFEPLNTSTLLLAKGERGSRIRFSPLAFGKVVKRRR